MQIATTGIALPEGKHKYEDPIVSALAEKFLPKKVTPYYVAFVPDDYESADIIVIARDRLLDLLIYDIEKVETRRDRATDPEERTLLERVLADLEQEIPACAQSFEESEKTIMRGLSPLSLKPTLVIDADRTTEPDPNTIIPQAMAAANIMFFYTAGKQEVRPWLVNRGTSAQGCAGKIHSDLAQGFVKAEIVPANDLLQCHSMHDARQRGLTRLVDRDFIIPEEIVLEIRFNI
ncbi:MAG: DUF933 domain-containing protein [Gammaproteobacteria bacterium]|nr:DUF933 domain-containing protein [Gammaproteobacteria bacterium]NNJ84130.1 DUF933 domain-containing protein [Gammaproteobacteria bacterium]